MNPVHFTYRVSLTSDVTLTSHTQVSQVYLTHIYDQRWKNMFATNLKISASHYVSLGVWDLVFAVLVMSLELFWHVGDGEWHLEKLRSK
jgi:hypothetical protein